MLPTHVAHPCCPPMLPTDVAYCQAQLWHSRLVRASINELWQTVAVAVDGTAEVGTLLRRLIVTNKNYYGWVYCFGRQ